MLDSDATAWRLILAANACSAAGIARAGRYLLAGDCLTATDEHDARAQLQFDHSWRALLPGEDPQRQLLDLYLPLVGTRAGNAPVIAQVGQSLDGFIALADGRSHYVTGPTSLVHLHRLRALSDCVIVGANTVAADDPQLTTRRVPGPHPTRVILDPRLRLAPHHKVFQDRQAPTIRVRAQGVPLPPTMTCSHIEEVQISSREGRLDLEALISHLRSLGHRTVLVEGGGVTIAAFLAAGLLQRLHVVSAPMLIGLGRPGLPLPEPPLGGPQPVVRAYPLDDDVLFDCDLRGIDFKHSTG